MIKIDQAFIQSFIDGNFFDNENIAHENVLYAPRSGIPYAEIKNFPNEESGLSVSDINETDGVFQVILRYPENDGAVEAKIKADDIMSFFSIGSTIMYQDQPVTIIKTKRDPGFTENGWFTVIIFISYRAFIERG